MSTLMFISTAPNGTNGWRLGRWTVQRIHEAANMLGMLIPESSSSSSSSRLVLSVVAVVMQLLESTAALISSSSSTLRTLCLLETALEAEEMHYSRCSSSTSHTYMPRSECICQRTRTYACVPTLRACIKRTCVHVTNIVLCTYKNQSQALVASIISYTVTPNHSLIACVAYAYVDMLAAVSSLKAVSVLYTAASTAHAVVS
jgi:hypothetical protein